MNHTAVALLAAALAASPVFAGVAGQPGVAGHAGNNENPNGPQYSTSGTTVITSKVSHAHAHRHPVSPPLSHATHPVHPGPNPRLAVSVPVAIGPITSGAAMATSADHQDARQNPVSHSRQAASAATVTLMPTADCSGTSGIGGQGASFGLSFGSSWTNVNCERLEKVKAVAIVLNDPATAAELLCADDEYRAARARAGQPCHSLEARAEQRAPYSGNDPIVKYRLGLP